MGRTINGKSLKQVAEELSKPFKSSDFKENRFGYSYLPVEMFRQRLDDVVGILNYDFVTSEPQIITIGTRPQIALSGIITIKDDDGNDVTKKVGNGGAPVIMQNEKAEAVSFKNDLDSATADVFKRCCKALGIAGNQLSEMREDNKKSSTTRDVDPAEPIALYRVTLKEAFNSVGKHGYSAMVDIEGEGPRKLMIWKNGIDEIEKFIPISVFLEKYKAGKSFSMYGYKTVFKMKNGQTQAQLVLERPYTGNEEGS